MTEPCKATLHFLEFEKREGWFNERSKRAEWLVRAEVNGIWVELRADGGTKEEARDRILAVLKEYKQTWVSASSEEVEI